MYINVIKTSILELNTLNKNGFFLFEFFSLSFLNFLWNPLIWLVFQSIISLNKINV